MRRPTLRWLGWTGFGLLLLGTAYALLTPVAALPGMMPLYQGGAASVLHGTLFYDNELFFSGHAGVPFLYCLLSRGHRAVAAACLAVSLLNAAGVLLTRNHYSLDVLGAFFIAPTIVLITRRLFGGLAPEAARA